MIPNTLWQKASGPPILLPYSDVDPNGLPWDNLVNNADGRAACRYAAAPAWPDFDPLTQVCDWVSGAWQVNAKPASIPASIRVTKNEWIRLFTFAEQVHIEGLKKAIAGQTAAEFSDPSNIPMQMLAVGFEALSNIPEFIEVTDSQVTAIVNTVLVGAGVLTTARAARVLQGLPPL
jgi:hypothetical protein